MAKPMVDATLTDRDLTRAALLRRVREQRTLARARNLWLAEFDRIFRDHPDAHPRFVDVLSSLQKKNPDLGDILGIVLDDLDDGGYVSVGSDGRLRCRDRETVR